MRCHVLQFYFIFILANFASPSIHRYTSYVLCWLVDCVRMMRRYFYTGRRQMLVSATLLFLIRTHFIYSFSLFHSATYSQPESLYPAPIHWNSTTYVWLRWFCSVNNSRHVFIGITFWYIILSNLDLLLLHLLLLQRRRLHFGAIIKYIFQLQRAQRQCEAML